MEHYSLTIDGNMRSAEQLFARWTDTIYLGFSGITNWDAFAELMYDCFDGRDIVVDVAHGDLSGLGERDRRIYSEILAEIAARSPAKIRISQ